MTRSLTGILAASALALTLLLGCGGGGGGGGGGGNNNNPQVGVIRNELGDPLAGAQVTYYNSTSNVPLATVTVDANGRLPSPPPSATRFAVDGSPILNSQGQARYQSNFRYNGGYFISKASNAFSLCLAALPEPGTNGGFTADIYLPFSASPPPPPGGTGCVGTSTL